MKLLCNAAFVVSLLVSKNQLPNRKCEQSRRKKNQPSTISCTTGTFSDAYREMISKNETRRSKIKKRKNIKKACSPAHQ